MQVLSPSQAIDAIEQFLLCPTPESWLEKAQNNLPLLLIDHAHCEKKAASTALNLMYRYPEQRELMLFLSQLAREELLHFEKVLEILIKRNIAYCHLSPAAYAGSLHQLIAKNEPERLVDSLIVAAIIEARSCERFYRLIPFLDNELQHFYQTLVKSEARHFENYLKLAKTKGPRHFDEKLKTFLKKEKALIQDVDKGPFRFHSGA